MVSIRYKVALTSVRGKRRKDTVLICLSQDDVEEGRIALNKGTCTFFGLMAHLQLPEETVPSSSVTLVTSRPPMISNMVKGEQSLNVITTWANN